MNILPVQTNKQGKKYATFEFSTNDKAMKFIQKTDKILKRYSCFESDGKYYACYYLDNEKQPTGHNRRV